VTLATLEDAIRAWVVAAGVAGGVPDADRAVIIADQDGTRPPLPYVAVRVLTFDGRVGEDESLVDDGDPPAWHGRGNRTASVSLSAYGSGAEAWIERAAFLLGSPSVVALLRSAGLNVRPNGDLQNLSRVRDERTEVRFVRDFLVSYVREASVTETEPLVELELVEVESNVGDRTENLSIEVV
jgi:hypothetical protein